MNVDPINTINTAPYTHNTQFPVVVLIKFLCGRLSEKYSIVPKILSGLTGYVKEREVDSSTACLIAKELAQSVDVQALHQVGTSGNLHHSFFDIVLVQENGQSFYCFP